MRIAIIAAMPGELKPLVRGWRRERVNTRGARMWKLARGEDIWIAACAGMGAEAARRAFALAESDGALDLVLSIGWAGSIYEGVKASSVQIPTFVIDAQTGERFSLTDGKRKWGLVTTARVADATEKRRLAATYQSAMLVDMEAAAVARMAEIRGIPLLCVKGVSDGINAELPDFNLFIDANGQMRLARFLIYVAARPKYWSALMHLGRCSARAAENMRDLILEFMEEKDAKKLIATGSL
ncbi:MAG TPA: nucleoside phosphorylase [Edaphobacter sp.]|nr:nucleoside phosphorylase [Edaphobacter sp.]